RPVDIADNLLDIDGLRSGGNPAVDEHAISMDGYLDTNQSLSFCSNEAVTMDSATASASRSGCPGETYSACWFMVSARLSNARVVQIAGCFSRQRVRTTKAYPR